MTERSWHKGDHVAWDHAQGSSTGEIVRVETEPGMIQGFHYKASPRDPRYIVKSDKTGAEAAHKAEELREADE